MKRTHLKGSFATVAILVYCVAVVSTVPTDLQKRDCGDCQVVENLSCQKPEPTLSQYLQDILDQGQKAYGKLSPVIFQANPLSLTPKEASSLQAIRTESKKFYYVTLPEVVRVLTSSTSLTPAQIEQVNDVVSSRITQLAAIECVIEGLAPKLGFDCAQKRSVIDIALSGGDLYGAILRIVSDPNVKLTISQAQEEEIKKLYERNGQVFGAALNLFFVPKTTVAPPTVRATVATTTTTTTTTAAPSCSSSPTLGELLKEILDQGVNAYAKLGPIADNRPKDKLTPTEVDELQAILTQAKTFYKDLLPCVVNKLNTNAHLTPVQIQQVKDVLSQRVTMLTAVKYLIGSIGPRLNYDCDQQKAIIEISIVGIGLYGELLGVVEDTSVQPTISAERLAQINKLIADSERAFNAAFVAFNVGQTCANLPTTPQPKVCHRS